LITIINNILHLISSIRLKCNDNILSELKAYTDENLHISHGMILNTLYNNDGIIMSDLAKQIQRNKSTTTTLVKKLAKLGYIEIRKIENDDRVKLLYLTKKGKDFKNFYLNISENLTTTIFKNITKDEQDQLMLLLNKINDSLDEK